MYKLPVILTVAAISAFSQNASSQKRPSDIRKEKLEQQGTNKVFDEKDADFKVKEVPEKWKKESAVVLAQKVKYEYVADGRVLNFVETKRKRIKLLDKAAVESFSLFYYYQNGTDFKIGIRIIKPDGTIKNISTSEAIEVTSTVPAFFGSSIYGFRLKYYKVALSDLETNDIIDFFSEVHGYGLNYTGAAQSLSPIFFSLNGPYPIVKQRYDFIAERGYFINFKSLNGAPELKQNANLDHRTFSYTLEDSDRPRIKDIRWLYDLRALPSVKFQVCYAKIGTECEQFLGKVGVPVNSVTPEEIAAKVNYRYNDLTNRASFLVKDIQSFMKKNNREVKDPMKYLQLSYYYLRHTSMMSDLTPGQFINDNSEANNDIFVVIMRELLKELEVDADVVVSSPRSLSSINDIVMFDELSWALKVKDKIIFPFNVNSCIYESSYYLENCEALQVEINRRVSLVKFKKITIPATTASDNSLTSSIDVQLDDNKEMMKVKSHTTIKGLLKSNNDYTFKNTDYLSNDYLIYGAEKPEEEVTKNKTKLAEIERKETSRKEEQKKEKLKSMKESMSDDFSNVVSYDNFILEEPGRSTEKPVLKYSEEYKLNDLVKKVGPNYSVDLTALIGKQVDIKSDEKEREQDVYLNYAKSLDYTITLAIPVGYRAEGLDALKFNVDNNAGSFVSEAKSQDNKLVITAKKSYKSAYVTKADWKKMVEFLDAAFNFTQKKIILKKA